MGRPGGTRRRRAVLAAVLVGVLLPAGGFAAPGGSKCSVIVSIADQRTYVYQEGRLVRAMVCSTGIPGTENATPLGDYVINESGQKRGEWFFSERFGEGAKYWVGFIGGVYLFHSIPMDKDKRVIAEEAAKLGRPASHGCIRLSIEDAYWFYTTVPDRATLRIIAASHVNPASPAAD